MRYPSKVTPFDKKITAFSSGLEYVNQEELLSNRQHAGFKEAELVEGPLTISVVKH